MQEVGILAKFGESIVYFSTFLVARLAVGHGVGIPLMRGRVGVVEPGDGALLLQTGDYLLLEGGDKLLFE